MQLPVESGPIRIAAALISARDGRLLLVRKRGTGIFMQPGGKIDANETPLAALLRELHEELGLSCDPQSCFPLGRFAAPAANEPGRMIEAELFELRVADPILPAAEIEEAVWVDADAALSLPLAPLTRDHVLPLHRRRHARTMR